MRVETGALFEEQWLKKVNRDIAPRGGRARPLPPPRSRCRLIWEDLQISSANRDIYDELAQHLIQLGEERGLRRKYYRLTHDEGQSLLQPF